MWLGYNFDDAFCTDITSMVSNRLERFYNVKLFIVDSVGTKIFQR